MGLANVKGWQTDLKTGLIVPGTMFEDHNTIQNDLRYYLAYKIGTNTTDRALNNLFTVDGTPGGGHVGQDGIAHGTAYTSLTDILATSLSVGGDNTVNYIEFYGYIDGAVSLTNNLYLGQGFIISPNEFSYQFASYDINTSVGAGRRFHFYWRIRILGAGVTS